MSLFEAISTATRGRVIWGWIMDLSVLAALASVLYMTGRASVRLEVLEHAVTELAAQTNTTHDNVLRLCHTQPLAGCNQ